MKKIAFVLFFVMVVIGTSFAQNNNIQQNIVGTWVEEGTGIIWVFNNNGTYSAEDNTGRYAIIDAKLALTNNPMDDRYPILFDILISNNGRTLFITYGMMGTQMVIWLNKR